MSKRGKKSRKGKYKHLKILSTKAAFLIKRNFC